MAPKRKPARAAVASDPDGMFRGVSAFVVPHAVLSRRLEVWKQRLVQMGGRVQEKLAKGAAVTHVLAVDAKALLRELDAAWLHRFRGSVVSFEWLEECLKSGQRLPEHKFVINYEEEFKPKKAAGTRDSGASQPAKRSKMPPEGPENHKETSAQDREKEIEEASSGESTTYTPPDLNRNITEIFGKLINIYRALGDDRRSFSYYKAIPVIEKLPFKIESADQVKDLPAIGKSLKDHCYL